MSERKDWKVTDKVLVDDANYWDDTKSALRDIVWDAGTQYQEEQVILLNDKGRLNTFSTMFHSNQYTSQINPANWVQAPTTAYAQMGSQTSTGGYSITSSTTGGQYVGFKINMKQIVNSISPNILKGLTSTDDIKKRIASLDFNIVGQGTGLLANYSGTWSGVFNNLGNAWEQVKPDDTTKYQVELWDIFAYISKEGLENYMDDDCIVYMYWYGGGYRTMWNWKLTATYMMSLNHLWMPRNESYTRDQISGEFVRLMSGKAYYTDKTPENFTKAKNTGGSPSYDGWDLSACPHVIYADPYKNNYGTNTLPTTLSAMMAGLYPLPAYYLTVPQWLLTGRVGMVPPKTRYASDLGWHIADDYAKPLVFKFDLIAGMQKEYPDLVPTSNTRQQNADILKKLDNRFVFTTTMGHATVNPKIGSRPAVNQTPDLILESFLWRATTSTFVRQRQATIPKTKVIVDETTGSAVADADGDTVNINLSLNLTSGVQSYITDDGYLYYAIIIHGYVSNPIDDIENVVRINSNGRTNLYSAPTDKAPHFLEDYQIGVKMTDIYERVTSHDADIANLQAQIDALKNP